MKKNTSNHPANTNLRLKCANPFASSNADNFIFSQAVDRFAESINNFFQGRKYLVLKAAYFHQSHLKKHQDYGHQVIAVLLSCNGIILNYAFVLYDKTVSKIESVRKIAQELPCPPNKGYFLCDSWYPAKNLIESFTEKGFFTIGAVKTNRVIYPCGIKQQAKKFAGTLSKEDSNINLASGDLRSFRQGYSALQQLAEKECLIRVNA